MMQFTFVDNEFMWVYTMKHEKSRQCDNYKPGFKFRKCVVFSPSCWLLIHRENDKSHFGRTNARNYRAGMMKSLFWEANEPTSSIIETSLKWLLTSKRMWCLNWLSSSSPLAVWVIRLEAEGRTGKFFDISIISFSFPLVFVLMIWKVEIQNNTIFFLWRTFQR